VWFVTLGARSVGDPGVPVQPIQALLWGFGRSAALEHPEWRFTTVDLSPEVGTDDISALMAELSEDEGEDRIAWRPEGRFAERLVRRRDAGRRTAGDGMPAGAYGLTIGVRGVLDNLRWQDMERLPPQAGEVEIEVEATGLNFRDVLNAMGLYPGTPPPFGSECAGRVVAVGEGVAHVRAGDPVVAIASDSFRRFVCAPAAFVRLRPAHRPTVESATVPIAYVTASFALEDVARIAPGERVLVHAAAGGVGLAAVHIARAAGAEVFATAGSCTKREYLRSLGIRHVMDSRSTEFAGQIMEATGGEGVHVVLNSLAGEAIPKSLSVLSAAGRFVELGKRGTWTAYEVAGLRRDVRYEVIDWGATAQEDPDRIGRVFGGVMDRVFRGELPALPFRVFPAARIVDAFRHMNRGRHMGKVVVTHPPRRRTDSRDAVPVRPDAMYLVTGGLGGLGLLTASWLVERGARHLVLVGRREPDVAAATAIREMESAGARVRSVSADVTDAGRMRALLRELVDGAPPLRGIVHSAGVLDDGVLLQQNPERFGRVLAPKVAGSWILHEATLRGPLDFFVLYSSIASVFGSAGQSNHAAANAYLDSLAWERRALGVPSVSINWGAWSEVGAAARRGVGEKADETGIGGIPPAEGMEILGRLLNPERPQVGVAVVDWPRFLERTGSDRLHFYRGVAQARRAPDEKAAEAPPVTWLEELAGLPVGNRLSLLEARIAEKAVRVLGIDGGQPPDPRRPLQEMGLDSLMAVELRNALAQGSGRPLPSTLLFDHPTIEALVAFLAPLLGAVPETGIPTGVASPVHEAAPANVVSRIEEMSDEEVDRLLAERTGKGSGSDE
jgi:myxalamid-type polyketide synthase MxaB